MGSGALCLALFAACEGGKAHYVRPGLDAGDERDAAPEEAGPTGDAGADAAVDAGPPPDAGCRIDADNDGVLAPECGGRDCNDADPATRPRADDPGVWRFERADELGWAATPSIAVGGDALPYVVFEDRAIDAVVLAVRQAEETWAREVVEAAAREPSAALDGAGALNVLFVSVAADPRELRHGVRDAGGGWHTTTVIPAEQGHVPSHPALANVDAGEVVGAYVDARQDGDIVRVLARDQDGGGWTGEDVTGDGGLPEAADGRVAVALGPGDVPWLAWTSGGALRVGSGADGAWTLETVPLGGAAAAPALAIGADGAVVVSHQDVAARAVVVARRALDGAWTTEVVDDRDGAGDPSAVAVDPSGAVHLLYHVPDRFDTRWATNAYGSWLSLVLERSAEASLAIAMDAAGAVHMAYPTTDSDLHWALHSGGDGIDQDCNGLPDDGDE